MLLDDWMTVNAAKHGYLLPLQFTLGNGNPVDLQPPSAPGTPAATGQTASTISLAWTASSDNVGVASYAVYWGPARHRPRT